MPESKRRKPKSRPQPSSTAVNAKDPSPTWYVAVMAGLMIGGVLLVLLRFVFEWDQMVMIAGLVAIAGGFLMTTNYR
jgi:hypothetical protein